MQIIFDRGLMVSHIGHCHARSSVNSGDGDLLLLLRLLERLLLRLADPGTPEPSDEVGREEVGREEVGREEVGCEEVGREDEEGRGIVAIALAAVVVVELLLLDPGSRTAFRCCMVSDARGGTGGVRGDGIGSGIGSRGDGLAPDAGTPEPGP